MAETSSNPANAHTSWWNELYLCDINGHFTVLLKHVFLNSIGPDRSFPGEREGGVAVAGFIISNQIGCMHRSHDKEHG